MDYLYQRRRGLAKTAGVVSGIYVLGRYVSHRLDTMRGTFVEERAAQDK
jgi:peroxin-3